MFLNFNGTAIYVYGAMRTNHGLYSSTFQTCSTRPTSSLTWTLAQLDGGQVGFFLGSADSNKFQQDIFQAKALNPNVKHTVVGSFTHHANTEETDCSQRITNLPSQTSPPPNATNRYFLESTTSSSPPLCTLRLWSPSQLTPDRDADTKVWTTTYDDSSSIFSYTSTFSPAAQNDFYNNTMHTSSNVGDSMKFA